MILLVSFVSADITTGLKLYIPFNGSINDYSGDDVYSSYRKIAFAGYDFVLEQNSNDIYGSIDGTDTDIIYNSDGANCDGVTSKITMGNNAFDGLYNYTFITTFKPKDVDTASYIISLEGRLFDMRIVANLPYCTMYSGGVTYVVNGNNVLTNDKEITISCSINSTHLYMFIDGVKQNIIASIPGYPDFSQDRGQNFCTDYSDTGTKFNGSIKNIYVFNKTLTDKEIIKMHNNGFYQADISDSVGFQGYNFRDNLDSIDIYGSNDGVDNNIIYDNNAVFDGSTSYISFDEIQLNSTGNFSIAFKLKLDGSDTYGILGLSSSDDNKIYYSGGRLYIISSVNGDSCYGTYPNDNEYHNVVITVGQNECSFFVDNVEDNDDTSLINNMSINQSGKVSISNNYLDGSLSYLYIYNYTLSPTEISKLNDYGVEYDNITLNGIDEYVEANLTEQTTVSLNYQNSSGEWHTIVNNSGEYWLDGEETTPIYPLDFPYLLSTNYIIGRYGVNYFNGSIQNFRVYDRLLTNSDILLLNYTVAEDVLLSDLILSYSNFTEYPFITQYDEFYVNINHTINDVVITDSSCNFTGYNISAVFSNDSTSNFTLTGVNNLFLNIHEGNTNIIDSSYRFGVCYTGSLEANLQVYVNNVLNRTVSSSVIPMCTNGIHHEVYNTPEFNSLTNFNISLRCAVCSNPNKRLRVVSINDSLLNFYRKFSSHTEPLTYNPTTELYSFTEYFYTFQSSSNYSKIDTICNDSTTSTDEISVSAVEPIINILSINSVLYEDGMQIESTDNVIIRTDIYDGLIDTISFNVTYENGTYILGNNTELLILNNSLLNVDGIYNISIYALDVDGDSSVKTGYFNINDTTNPVITINNPNEENTSIFIYRTTEEIDVSMSDLNLYAYEILLRDPNGTLKLNITESNLPLSSYNIKSNVTFNTTGVWTLTITASDSHTKKEIDDYKYVKDVKKDKIDFMFYDENISIEYTGKYKINDMDVIKDIDRYRFDYDFYISSVNNKASYEHSFRVVCSNIEIVKNSDYKGHLVCPDQVKWVDFEDYNSFDYSMEYCGYDCVEVTLWTTEKKLEFNSIGGLNIVQKVVSFEVNDIDDTVLRVNVCPESIAGQFSLFICITFLLVLIILGFYFRVGWLLMIGGLGLFPISWTISACLEYMGLIVAVAGIFFFIYGAVKDWY